jgi:hypothetical protein
MSSDNDNTESHVHATGHHKPWSGGQTTDAADHKQTIGHRKTAANTGTHRIPKNLA